MSPNGTTHQNLDDLFPAPSLPPSPLSPQRLPGANLESLAAVLDVLKDNHKHHHIFFHVMHFHNHTTHRALAVYALGGPAAIIRDYYEQDKRIQRPVIKSPEPITEENFADHLGDENFYQAYITFFSKQVFDKGAARTLEEFFFSEKYNFRKERDANTQPEMLSHLFSALMHSMIHVGYGVEFGLKGMFIEGLALAAVDFGYIKGALPASSFVPASTDVVEHLANRLSSCALDAPATTDTPVVSKRGGVHAFDITARILKDDRLICRKPTNILIDFKEMFAKYAPTIIEHVERWSINLNEPGEIERKMEEVIWLNTLIYGVGGSTPNGFHGDFFFMHFVTSSLFLPSLLAYLSPRSQALLLRSYFVHIVGWWVIRGRPALDIKPFMATTSVEPSISTIPAPKTSLSTETTPVPNPFLLILQSAIMHPVDHVSKIQRAFCHFDTLYGRRPAGYFKDTELNGAELLDGSLFLRASLLTADYMGWVHEGQEPKEFYREGFYR